MSIWEREKRSIHISCYCIRTVVYSGTILGFEGKEVCTVGVIVPEQLCTVVQLCWWTWLHRGAENCVKKHR
jgi:hypothetical protein